MEQSHDQTGEIRERLSKLEEEVQNLSAAIAEIAEDDGDSEPPEGEGQKALRLALASFLNTEAVLNAVTELCKLPERLTTLKEKDLQYQKEVALKSYYVGISFSVLLLLIVATLAWNDKITKEITAGLLGSLVGYWYGRDRPK